MSIRKCLRRELCPSYLFWRRACVLHSCEALKQREGSLWGKSWECFVFQKSKDTNDYSICGIWRSCSRKSVRHLRCFQGVIVPVITLSNRWFPMRRNTSAIQSWRNYERLLFSSQWREPCRHSKPCDSSQAQWYYDGPMSISNFTFGKTLDQSPNW